MHRRFIAACCMGVAAYAAATSPPDYSLVLEPARTVEFTTQEGTWMSLDVSPDGKALVFELLGDLYTLPIEGGTAKRITSGMAVDSAPRFSPDGRTIAYLSDSTGAVNLWLVDSAGINPHALTRERMVRYLAPAWLPDGTGIVAPRFPLPSRAERTPKAHILVHALDGAPPVPLLSDDADQPSQVGGVAVSPEGRTVYAAALWGKDDTWQVLELDMAGNVLGRAVDTMRFRHSFRPLVSPDGNFLAYIERRDSRVALWLRDLHSQRERFLVGSLDDDIVNVAYGDPYDLYQGYAFTPDGRFIVMANNGKIWKIEVASGVKTEIPFTAHVQQSLAPLGRLSIDDEAEAMLTVRQVRFPAVSPDGKRVAFSALGRIWIMDLPSGTPRRLTDVELIEDYAAWSPDGRYLSYVTWQDDGGGDVFRVRLDDTCLRLGRCVPENITRNPGFYAKLTYTRDGNELLAVHGAWTPGRSSSDEVGNLPPAGGHARRLVRIPLSGGEPEAVPLGKDLQGFLRTAFGLPHFTADDRILLWGGKPDGAMVSIAPDGSNPHKLFDVISAYQPPNAFAISPDGKHAAAVGRKGVYLVCLPADGSYPQSISLDDPDASRLNVRYISHLAEEFVSWSPDSRKFYFSIAHTLFEYDLDSARAVGSAYQPRRMDIQIRASRDKPEGTIVLRGARLITMKDQEVIEQGDLLIQDNRIAAVGRTGEIAVPPNAKIIDLSGKTILPGYVDVHAHPGPRSYHSENQPPQFLAMLAYGVTTARDPSTEAYHVDYTDRIAIGQVIGPRYWTVGSGPPLDWFKAEGYETMRRIHDKLGPAYLNTHTTKQYNFGDRLLRQWTVKATRSIGASTTNHGRVDEGLSMILDGFAGLEHPNLLGFPLYDDYVKLFAASGTTWTLTLLPAGSSAYFLRRYDVHGDEKLQRFFPHEMLDQKWSVARATENLTEQRMLHEPLLFEASVERAAKLAKGGGRIGIGEHGELPGLGTHFELWALALGGMPNHEILRSGTIVGAESIGLGRDVGSLELGKLADLQVLDANPLDNIENTNTLRYVMKNGRLYEAATLDEMWPRQRGLPSMWWWTSDSVPRRNRVRIQSYD